MDKEEWFIENSSLPNSLSKKKFEYLLNKTREGDRGSLEKLVLHNIRLVLFEVAKKYKNTDYDKKELVAVGNIDLLKALNTYDLSREIVNNLPDRDREIIIMYFGFDGDNICTQNDIAEKFNISQSYASRVINKILVNIKSELERQNII